MTTNLDAIVPKDSVAVQHVNGAAVLMDTRTGNCFELNRTAAEIWDGLARGESISEIADRLAGTHAVTRSTFEKDVRALLAELALHGLVVVPPVDR